MYRLNKSNLYKIERHFIKHQMKIRTLKKKKILSPIVKTGVFE